MDDERVTFTPGEGVQALREMHAMTVKQLSIRTGIEHRRLYEIERSVELGEADAVVLARALRTYPRLLMSWNPQR